MAFKLGDFFDKFGEGMKAMSGYFSKEGGKEGGGRVDSVVPKSVLDDLDKARKNFDELGDSIKEIKDKLKSGNVSMQERIDLDAQLEELQEKSVDTEKKVLVIDKLYSKERDLHIKRELNFMSKGKKGYSDLGVASEKFETDLKSLWEQLEANTISASQFDKELDNLKLAENVGQAMGFAMGEADQQFKAVGAMAGNAVGGMLKKVLPPHLQIIAELIEQIFIKAFEQLDKLNKQLITTLRTTGGVVNSTMLGFDEFGNSMKSGVGSLETQAIAANISAQEFGQSITNLFKDGFGQVAGLKTNLRDSADELAHYGVEAARMNKLYGADISGSVRNLMMNFGTGMKDSTNLVKENIDYARKAGLNVQEVVKNLEAATALAGKFYFESTTQLTKLTFIASTLGVSVNALTDNVIKMNGITDLFKKQQEMAALELGNVASSLAKVYALRAQGKGGEATEVMMASLAKDLMSKGMINKGQVTQQGIATMNAAGIDQEVIQGLSRMARQAEETGISMQKMLNPEMMTKAEQRKLEAAEKNNRTIEEQMKMTFGGLKQAIIDPIAKTWGPLLKSILSGLEPIIGVISTIISTIQMIGEPFFQIFQSLQEQTSAIFKDIFEPMKRMFESVQNAIRPVIDIFKQIIDVVIKFLAVPLRIVGKVIGFFFDVISKIVSTISDALKPAFDWLSEAFTGLSEGIDAFLDVVDDVLGWLLDAVGWLINGVFKVLGWTIKYLIIEPFKALWTVLKSVGEFIWEGFMEPIVDGFKSLIDFFQPVWDVLADLFAPLVWLWDLISSWFGGDKDKNDEDATLTPAMVEEMFGKATEENVNAQTQNIKPEVQTYLQEYKTRASDEQAKENERLMKPTFSPVTNVVVNTKVDPLLGSSNSVKKPT